MKFNNITITTELITPEMAEGYLAKNIHNRNIRMEKARAYAADMGAGAWQRNGETIKFDKNGNMIDGQHRMLGIKLSGVSVEMMVVHGLDTESQDTIDAGIPRKFADVLKLHGELHYASLGAAVRGIYKWEQGFRGFGGGGGISPTNTQLMDTLNKYPWVRESMTLLQQLSAHAALPASVSGPLWWLFTAIDSTDAEDFFNKLVHGGDLQIGSPILALRKQLLASRESKRVTRNVTFLAALTVKAWNKYRLGEEATILSWRPGGANPEKFPEPK